MSVDNCCCGSGSNHHDNDTSSCDFFPTDATVPALYATITGGPAWITGVWPLNRFGSYAFSPSAQTYYNCFTVNVPDNIFPGHSSQASLGIYVACSIRTPAGTPPPPLATYGPLIGLALYFPSGTLPLDPCNVTSPTCQGALSQLNPFSYFPFLGSASSTFVTSSSSSSCALYTAISATAFNVTVTE